MASKLSIWNRALQKLGSEQLVNVTTSNKRARALDVAYEPVRDALLESYAWTFAKKFENIAADGTYSPAWRYANQYPLPSDCLAVLEVDTTYPYEVVLPKSAEGSTPAQPAVFTDYSGSLPVLYVAKVDNVSIYSGLFREYLATMLAYECCEEITQSSTKKQELARDLINLEKRAKAACAKQRSPEELEDGSWWDARA